MNNEYDKLLSDYKETVIASSIKSVLYWDIETNKMPSKGLSHRSTQFSYLTQKEEEFWNSQKLKNALNKIKNQELNELQHRNVSLIERNQKIKTKISTELISNLSSKSNTTNQIWKKAKYRKDFSIVQNDMKELFELNRDYATRLADIKDMNDPFDAIIDQRDEGLNSKIIGKYFDEAKNFLVPFLKKNTKDLTSKEIKLTKLKVNKERNFEIAKAIADMYNYRYSGEDARGSIDAVEHPLTITCGPDDVRITIKHGNMLGLVNTTNHELGHGIHSLNKNPDWKYQPVNHSSSPTLGECISRYTENKIGKSQQFSYYFYPILKNITGTLLNEYTWEEFHKINSAILPGPIRTSADEVTYGLHIIIRFEIEKMLFNDKLSIAELPQIWNDKYKSYLGIEIENDKEGVMQDLHWYNTYWGYFHGYFMGDLIGSQLHYTMEENIGKEWQNELNKGNLNPVLNWHIENIFSKGYFYSPLELLKNVTGSNLDVKYFKDYIENKYV